MKLMIRMLHRAALLLLACLSVSVLSSCGAEAVSEKETAPSPETNGAPTEAETSRETEETFPAVPAPDAEAVRNHEKLSLWDEDNIPFAMENGGRDATIQPFLLDGADASVVIFPGGGYFQLSEESEGIAVAKAYNALGFNAFVVCYRYEPYDGRAILADGQRAVQYVRYYAQSFGVDPGKIALCGFSAGGHLSVMVAEHDPDGNPAGDAIGACSASPNACILAYPVTTLGDGTYVTMPRIFLGEKDKDAEEIAKYSYPTNLDRMPPTFVFYSERDSLVDYEKNSAAFADAMRAAGKTVVCKSYPDGEHGVGLGTAYHEYSAWVSDSVKFLKDNGF